jgi:NAD+ kinase
MAAPDLLRRVGLAFNPTNQRAVALRDRVAGWLRRRSVETWSAPAGETETLVARLAETDALLVLGGDGTFLRAARALTEVDVPVLGINVGKVGFLSKVEEGEVEPVLERVLAGHFRIDERMTLEATVTAGGDGPREYRALNDVVVARGGLARVCRLEVSIGESHLATFVADGLVVASPTGSTGYSFSAGGPVVDPLARNLIVTPIAGYLSTIRSVIASPRQTVRCRVAAAHEALVSVDGWQDRRLAVGDVVEVRAGARPIRFVEPEGTIPFWDLFRRKVELLPS